MRVATYDSEGNEIWQAVAQVDFDEMGFRADAALIGAEYKAPAETIAQQQAKALNKLAMQADTLAEADAKRKGKALPFGGEIDPYKHQEDTLAARNTLYIERSGQQMDYNKMEVAEQVLSKVEVAKLLKPRIEAAGGNWPEAVKTLQRLYPAGVVAGELEAVFERLKTSGSLKLVKGA